MIKLGEQTYQVLDRWKIAEIWHKDLLWDAKQIVRLRTWLFTAVDWLLKTWPVSLYNAYNPINTDLIREFRESPWDNDLAVIWEICDRNEKWPIINWSSLMQVWVLRMDNVRLVDIETIDLVSSIAGRVNLITDVNWLIAWLSKEFYEGKITEEEFYKQKELFFRRINKIN